MKQSNQNCPFCGKGNVFYLEKQEMCNQNDMYCKNCGIRYNNAEKAIKSGNFTIQPQKDMSEVK